MSQLDKYFAKYIAVKSQGDVMQAYVLLVDAIGHGNGEYIKAICRSVGHPKDMLKAASELIRIGSKP